MSEQNFRRAQRRRTACTGATEWGCDCRVYWGGGHNYCTFGSAYIAQRISFAIARGRQLASAEVARKELALQAVGRFPDGAGRYSLVAKIIEPSVVGVQSLLHVSADLEDVALIGPNVRAMSQGSGVIVDSSGYIVTNAHVLDHFEPAGVTVQLSDGRTIQHATVVGTDPATDLAVLKIDAGKLLAATWGDSDAIQVGEPVLAVGSPYGLVETVTAGIITPRIAGWESSRSMGTFCRLTRPSISAIAGDHWST